MIKAQGNHTARIRKWNETFDFSLEPTDPNDALYFVEQETILRVQGLKIERFDQKHIPTQVFTDLVSMKMV